MTGEMKAIHTLNARGNVMLEVTRDYFQLSSVQMQRQIQLLRIAVEEALAKKGNFLRQVEERTRAGQEAPRNSPCIRYVRY